MLEINFVQFELQKIIPCTYFLMLHVVFQSNEDLNRQFETRRVLEGISGQRSQVHCEGLLLFVKTCWSLCNL